MKRPSQKQLVLNLMMDGTPIDQPTATKQFKIKALSTVIGQLRKEGYHFDKTYHKYGERRVITRWHLRHDV